MRTTEVKQSRYEKDLNSKSLSYMVGKDEKRTEISFRAKEISVRGPLITILESVRYLEH